MQHDGCGEEIRAIGITGETQARGVQAVSLRRLFNEGGEGFRFRADILLIEIPGAKAAEETGDALLRRVASQTNKRGGRRHLAPEWQEARLVAARSVQQHKRRSIRGLRLMDPVHKGQVAIDDARLSRKPELRQHGHDVFRAQMKVFGDEDLAAERVRRLVDRKARAIRGEFNEPTGGLADIERVEIFAVMHVDRVVTTRPESYRLRFDGGAICHAQGDMIDGTRARSRRPEAARIAHVHRLPTHRGQPRDRAVCRSEFKAGMAAEEVDTVCRLFRQ